MLNMSVYVKGQKPNDLEQAWVLLEKQEYLAEVALKEELLRQEKLEQLADKFERKSALREGYLNEMIGVLSDPRYGSNLQQVDASVKKHEAISADILSRVERFKDLKAMSTQLKQQGYHREEELIDREKIIRERWDQLLDLLRVHKEKLDMCSSITILQRDMQIIAETMKSLQHELESTEPGSHLLDVQEKLQRFHLQECQVKHFVSSSGGSFYYMTRH